MPQGNHLGYWVVLVPVVGALIIGLMARFGSEKIRGHGIPEALEAILLGRSRISNPRWRFSNRFRPPFPSARADRLARKGRSS